MWKNIEIEMCRKEIRLSCFFVILAVIMPWCFNVQCSVHNATELPTCGILSYSVGFRKENMTIGFFPLKWDFSKF